MIRSSKRVSSIRTSRVRKPARAAFRPRPLGPRDEGLVLTESQYLRCTDAPGYVSEIFDGAVHVSPSAKPSHNYWRFLIQMHLHDFGAKHRSLIGFVAGDNDVVVPFRPGPTRPRPDITVYRDFPVAKVLSVESDWSQFCPILVVEVISPRRRRKDTDRNRQLYWSAGGIAEYWIVDPRNDPAEPIMLAHWREIGRPDWTDEKIDFGDTYQSRTMPELSINLKKLLEQA